MADAQELSMMHNRVNDLLAERHTSARNAMKADPEFAQLFAEMTPQEKAYGKLVGKLLEQGFGLKQINDVFAWWEQEHNGGVVLENRTRMLALFQAAETLGCDDNTYRLICKMFATANQH